MKAEFDLVFFGDGPLVQSLISHLDFQRGLLVSDGTSVVLDPRLTRIPYKRVCEISGLITGASALVSTRLDRLALTSQIELKNFFLGQNQGLFRSILVLSSCAVYGDTDFPIAENDPINPSSLYARMKIELENIVLATKVGESVTCLRIGNLYGFAGSNDFIQKLIDSSVDGSPVSIPRENCHRDFVYFGDLLRFISQWFKLKEFEKVSSLNFSTGVSNSLLSAIDLVSKLTSTKLLINYDLPAPEIVKSMVSNDLLMSFWQEDMWSLESGLNFLLAK